MSQQLTLEISDEVYADLQQKANAVGLSVSEWIVAVVIERNNRVEQVLSSDAQNEARQRFRSHAGVVDLGYPTGTDNERIDADLARAYFDDYKE